MDTEMELCAERVYRDAWSKDHHCSRKAGFGPDGLYCRQHAEKHGAATPTATWYRTSKWSFELVETAVISVSDKTILIKRNDSVKPSREKIASEYYRYWPTREEAVESLRKRLEGQRGQLAKAEQDFSKLDGLPRLRPQIILDRRDLQSAEQESALATTRDALEKIAELEGDCENQQFRLTRFQAAQIARAALALVDTGEREEEG